MSERQQCMEFITQDIVVYLMKDRKIEVEDAMLLFYNSEVFSKLHDENTGLYLESSLYVYDLLKNELRNGRLIQEEI